ncbi:uncharacterized protein DNG_06921 [Cephalotrichum gorgonifer]|uniref:Uncharacterized protein n=1 Tax=Cephalotrichum gorgonifer TaxID=2041049 RepID=A0AAE8N3C4_9PEZI|nr:uncharacterized protein DNG_06921 [Cephalotrichum gorgonifer]
MAGQNYYGTPAGDISPPSSPDVGDSRNARDVSPIDEAPDTGLDSRPPPARAPSHSKSNIPMMRRQRRQEQEAASSTLREAKSRERLRSHSIRREPSQDGQSVSTTGRQLFKTAQGRDIRWDAMTGEPNLGPTGVSSQVKPVEYVQGLKPAKGASASTSAADSGIPTSPTASTSAIARLRNAQNTFSDKLKAMRGAADAAGTGAGVGPNTRSPVSPGRPALTSVPSPEPVSDAPSPSAQSPSPSPASAPPPRKSSLGSNSLATRPEWKGASGRTTLVAPVQDTPQATPLQIPRKSSKRERYAKGRGARGGPGGPGALSPISPSGSETDLNRADPAAPNLISSPPAGSSSNQDPRTAYPSPPPHSASAAPPSPAADPHSPTAPAPVRAPISVDNARAVRRKPPSAAPPAPSASASASSHPSHAHHISTTSSIYSTFDSQTVPHPPESYRAPAGPAATTAAPEDNWTQPPSRFSVTTYATSSHTRSSNPSIDLDAPPMPSPPRDHHQSPPSKVGAPDPGAYMSSPYTSPAAEMRKAAALGRDNVPPYLKSGGWSSGATPSIFSDRPGSVASTSKALPLAPPEIEMQTANDRVGNLNARLESLAHRRININKSIKKMTELMPTDNLMASEAVLRKREIEKQKVEGLREELAEVQREEYELGLKLHRAYKRLDRDAEYEPTGLWVRRVTG